MNVSRTLWKNALRRSVRRTTPAGALLRGVVAGAVGSAVMNAFFQATRSITPQAPSDVFEPPEPQQESEMQLETVARRVVEQLARRGPLSPEQKKIGGAIVHYAFGAAWGGLYGLLRASRAERRPATRLRPLPEALSVLGFSSLVWLVGDEVLLPALRLSAWPNRYPAQVHAYAFAAHLVYGAAVAMAYEALTTRSWVNAALWTRSLLLRRRIAHAPHRMGRLLQPLLGTIAARARRGIPLEAELEFAR
jgi:hypothetical protein